jgi:peptidyl-prolyl cis-trans isomerase SurA
MPSIGISMPVRLLQALLASAALVVGLMAAPRAGQGQTDQPTSIPGLIITPTTPSAGRTVPRQPAAKTQSEAKPKPKPSRQREASAESVNKGPRISGQGIVVLVNDEPVTAYEVEQRAAFLAVSGGGNVGERARESLKQMAQSDTINRKLRAILEDTIKDNPGKTREQVLEAFEERKKAFVQSLQRQALESARAALIPSFKKKALEELVEERLKLQEAKRLNINVSDDDANKYFKNIADRNKMTEQQFADHLKGQGIDANTMKARLRAQAAWRDVIRRKFGHQIAITAREVDRVIATGSTSGEDQVELQLQKITLAAPGKLDQKTLAQMLDEAESLRRKFGGCKSTAALAKTAPNAKLEDLGYTKASSLPEPTRSLLLNAKDGEMLPGHLAQSGVELYAICGRRTVKADEQKRQQAQEELTQKEFDVLARRHLRDLRQDAMIEYR